MTTEQFCYWLQGFVELHDGLPTDVQWGYIKDHLRQVFNKQTPARLPEYAPAPIVPLDLRPTC